MKPFRVWAIARKEFIHILRDPRSIGMAIAIPMLLLGLFGYALTLDVDNVPMVVWDQSQSQASREFISHFTGSRYFSLQEYVRNYREVERAIDSGQALMALIIPTDFAGHVESGRAAPVQLIVDGSDSNTATIAMGYADAVTFTYTQAVATHEIRRIGGRALHPPVDLRARVWFNADLESKNGFVAEISDEYTRLLCSMQVRLDSCPVCPGGVYD